MSDADSERSSATYTALNQRFLVRDRNFKRQYSHIYSSRLAALRPALLSAVGGRWGLASPGAPRVCPKIVQLRPDEAGESTEWAVVGCIYKDMPLKPSILDSYSGACGPRSAAARRAHPLRPLISPPPPPMHPTPHSTPIRAYHPSQPPFLSPAYHPSLSLPPPLPPPFPPQATAPWCR
jgi:hypothetical protein